MPNLDIKKILLLILVVLAALLMFFGLIWLLFLRSEGGGVIPTETTGRVGGPITGVGIGGVDLAGLGGALPVEEAGEDVTGRGSELDFGNVTLEDIDETAIGSLTKTVLLAPVEVKNIFTSSQGINYLSKEDNKFYRLPFGSDKPILLSTETFPFVEDVTWSPDGRKVVLEYPDGANIVYDFTRNKKATLPLGLADPTFSQDSEKIAYKFFGTATDENWLIVSQDDGTGAMAVEPLGANGQKVQMAWSPNNQVVALYSKAIGVEKEEVFFVGLNGENFKSMVVDGSHFIGVWSPRGDRILYSVVNSSNNYNPVIWIVDAVDNNIGNNNFSLGLQTWPDKCVFSSDNATIYCAVPLSLPDAAGLYAELVGDEPDVFYKIDLRTGATKLIAYPISEEGVVEFQVKQIFTDTATGNLYFLDGLSSKIYGLRLR